MYKNLVTDTSDVIEVPPLPNKSCPPIYEPPNPVPDNAIPLPDDSVDVVTTNYTGSIYDDYKATTGVTVTDINRILIISYTIKSLHSIMRFFTQKSKSNSYAIASF